MCGSGTFLVEAAGMALDRAPALSRENWAFERWSQHEPKTWEGLKEEARERALQGAGNCPPIRGRDLDEQVIQAARSNLERADLKKAVELEVGALRKARPRLGEGPGLFITNPPYGERLGESETMHELHREIGDRLRQSFLGWDGWVLCGRKELLHALGLKAARKHILFNGQLECRFVHLPISNTPAKGGPGWRD
jgi:23S rRNA (guanine2445-N2)-methyltransferase / 23S rRNA (guanine2069-N7)-methyltransferase